VISRAYPRSVERHDGKVVTIYYFWDRKTGPERYIAATIWDPDTGRDSWGVIGQPVRNPGS